MTSLSLSRGKRRPVARCIVVVVAMTFLHRSFAVDDCAFPGFSDFPTRWRALTGPDSMPPLEEFTDGRVTVGFGPQNPQTTVFKCKVAFQDSNQYLVSTDSLDGPARFMCVQFIQRSAFILQMKRSKESSTADGSLCNDFSLVLSPYVFRRENVAFPTGPSAPLCPIQGGFVVSQWSREDGATMCASPSIDSALTTVESGCHSDKVIQFIGKGGQECPAPDIDVDGSTTFGCLGSWQDKSYVYTVLFSESGKTSCFRIPINRRGEFKAQMFLDSLCDTTPNLSESSLYRTLNLQLHPIYICTQDAPSCLYSRPGLCVLDVTSRTCRQTCNTCNPDTPFVGRRKLPRFMVGTWLRIRAVLDQDVITITNETVQVRPRVVSDSTRKQNTVLAYVDSFQCGVTETAGFKTLYLFLSVHDNGCAPRVYVMGASPVTPSVLKMNVIETQWSLLDGNLNDSITNLLRWKAKPEVICSLAVPDVNETFARAADAEASYYVLAWINTQQHVNFSFPFSKRYYQVAMTTEQLNCTAMANTTRDGMSFMQVFLKCDNQNHTKTTPWTYIPYGILPGSNGIFLITRTPGIFITDVYRCWWLPDNDNLEGYILTIRNCKEKVVAKVKAGQHVPIARLNFLKELPPEPVVSRAIMDRSVFIPVPFLYTILILSLLI